MLVSTLFSWASCIRAMGLSDTIGDLTDAAIDLTCDEDTFHEIEEHDEDHDDDDEQVVLEEDG